MHTYSDYKIFFVSGVLDSEREMKPVFKEGMEYRDLLFVNVTYEDEELGRGGVTKVGVGQFSMDPYPAT